MKSKYILASVSIATGMWLQAQESSFYKSEVSDYQQAIELYDQANFQAAKTKFSQLSEVSTKEQLLGNSQFYIASSALKLNEATAAQQMESFVRNFPTSNKRNKAFYELGEHYFLAGDFAYARKFFAQVDASELSREDKTKFDFKMGYCLFKANDFKKAQNYFNRIKNNPTYSNQANYYLGYIAYQEDDFKRAKDFFAQVETTRQIDQNMGYFESDMSFKAGDFEAAIEAAKAQLEKSNPRERSDLNKIIGESYFNLKQYEEAIPYLEAYQGDRRRWNNTDYYQLGYAYFSQGEYQKAEEEFNKIVGGKDKVAQNAYYHLAQAYLKSDKKQQALNAFKNASEMDFDKAIKQESFLNYAKLSYELGNAYTSVPEVLMAYLEKYPQSKEANEIGKLLIDSYISSKSYAKALELLEGSRDYDQKLAYQKVAFYYGVDFFKEGNFAKAREYFEKSLSQPFDTNIRARTIYWKAEADFNLGNTDEAIVGFKQFEMFNESKNTPEFKQLNYDLGYAYFQVKDYENAQMYFEKYSKQKTASHFTYDTHVRLGDVNFALGNYWPAMESYNKALEMKGFAMDYPAYQKAISYGFVDRNKRKIEELEKFINQYPNSNYRDNALYELGNTYVAENNNAKGIQAYQQIVSQHPKSSFVPRALSKEGLLYYNDGNNPKALLTLKDLVAKYPESEQARQAVRTVRLIYVDMGQPEVYAAWVKKLDFVELGDTEIDQTTYDAAEVAFLDNNVPKAIEGFEKYLQQFPQGLHALKSSFYLAQLYYNSGEKDKSIPHYTKVVNSSKSEFTEQSLSRLSQIYLEQERYEEAIPVLLALEEEAEFSENKVFAKTNLMKAYYRTNNYRNTLIYGEKTLGIRDLDVAVERDAHLFIARASIALNEFTKAKSAYQMVQSTATGRVAAEALYYQAFFEHQEGKYEKSSETVEKIAKDFSRFREFGFKGLILMAKNFHKLGDDFQANFILESVIDSTNGYPEIQQEAKDQLAKIKPEPKEEETSQEEDEENNQESNSNRPIKF